MCELPSTTYPISFLYVGFQESGREFGIQNLFVVIHIESLIDFLKKVLYVKN